MSNVTHPSHYNSGKIEVIEAIEDWKLNFNKGNAVKHIARSGRKDPKKEVEDLEKAIWYAKREIECLKAQENQRSTVKPNDMNPIKDFFKETKLAPDLIETIKCFCNFVDVYSNTKPLPGGIHINLIDAINIVKVLRLRGDINEPENS